MKLAISQVCSLHAQLPQCIEDYSAGTCPAIEVWLTALEYYLDQSSPEELRALLDAQGMSIPAASYQGGLLVSQGEERQVAWELFRRRLKLCRELLIPTLVVAADVPSPIRSGDMERVQVSLRQAAHEAAEYDICIALELQSGSAFGNNLQSVSALVDQTQHPNLGICLDVFHFGVGPSKESDLRAMNPQSLFHVQVSDVSGVPREFATDQHRILPGDGDLPLPAIIDFLKDIRYDRWISLEILNPTLWEIPPRQFGEIGMASLRKLITADRR